MSAAFRRLKEVITDFRRPSAPEAFRLPADALIRGRVAGAAAFLLGGLVAFLWANTNRDASYLLARDATLAAEFAGIRLSLTLRQAVNDGLMTLYFFSMALAARRRIGGWTDESRARVLVPSLAAAGIFLIPSLATRLFAGPSLFRASLAMGGLDVGLALAAFAVAGRPMSGVHPILIFSTAVETGWVISLFFLHGPISWLALSACAGLYLAAFGLRELGARGAAFGLLSGLVFWLAWRATGFPAALAGVFLSTLVPGVCDGDERKITELAEDTLDDYDRAMDDSDVDRCSALAARLGSVAVSAESPVDRWQAGTLSWLTWLVLPLFGWVNGGISLASLPLHGLAAVIAGIWLIGRPAGVLIAGGLARWRWGSEPGMDVDLKSLVFVSAAGGVPVAYGVCRAWQGSAGDPILFLVMAASLMGAMAGGLLLAARPRSD